MDEIIEEIMDAVIDGEDEEMEELTKQALDTGHTATDILDDGLMPAMDEVGQLFEDGDYFVPEMLLSAGAMEQSMKVLKPILVKGNYEPKGTVVVGSVQGDLHDIGKKLVGLMLQGQGFDIIDLGVDVSPEQFLEAVEKNNARIVGLSSLLTTTMPAMEATVKLLNEKHPHVKIMIGGAPVTQGYCDKINANGFGENSTQAINIANNFVACDN